MAALASVLLVEATIGAQSVGVPIPEEVLGMTARNGQASYLVVLRDRPDLADAERIRDRDARGWFVYRALKAVAERSQRPISDFLETERAAGRVMAVQRFFSVNAVGVTSSEASLRRLARFAEVDQIVPALVAAIPTPALRVPEAGVQSVEWNIGKVRAPEVWAQGFTGQNIVVANIDTGVQFDHPALVNQYRGNLGNGFSHDYNWRDATGTCGPAPCDDNGHGTHTMGTMVGSDGGPNQIGVAPGAAWMACKALGGSGAGSLFDLIECGDWILAPSDLSGANPDPGRRPHVVNNSWGFAFGGIWFLEGMVQNWRAAGIFPAFSVGNTGPSCGTVTSPADYVASFATGATNTSDAIASFSSRGPSLFGGAVKPDATAPGVNVRSSVPGSAYAVFSGTSMASPHTAGVVALLWSQYEGLRRDVANTERKLRPGAEILNSSQGCGGDASTAHPNNTFGWGRLDAIQTQNPFPVYTDRSVYQAGDLHRVLVSLVNPGNQVWPADAYLGIELPDGQTFLFPFGTIQIPSLVELFDVPQYSATFTGAEPSGTYRWLSMLVSPGADPSNPLNQLSVDYAPFVVP